MEIRKSEVLTSNYAEKTTPDFYETKLKLSNELDAMWNSACEMLQIHLNTEQTIAVDFYATSIYSCLLGDTSGDGAMRDGYILWLAVTMIFVKGL